VGGSRHFSLSLFFFQQRKGGRRRRTGGEGFKEGEKRKKRTECKSPSSLLTILSGRGREKGGIGEKANV